MKFYWYLTFHLSERIFTWENSEWVPLYSSQLSWKSSLMLPLVSWNHTKQNCEEAQSSHLDDKKSRPSCPVHLCFPQQIPINRALFCLVADYRFSREPQVSWIAEPNLNGRYKVSLINKCQYFKALIFVLACYTAICDWFIAYNIFKENRTLSIPRISNITTLIFQSQDVCCGKSGKHGIRRQEN